MGGQLAQAQMTSSEARAEGEAGRRLAFGKIAFRPVHANRNRCFFARGSLHGRRPADRQASAPSAAPPSCCGCGTACAGGSCGPKGAYVKDRHSTSAAAAAPTPTRLTATKRLEPRSVVGSSAASATRPGKQHYAQECH